MGETWSKSFAHRKVAEWIPREETILFHIYTRSKLLIKSRIVVNAASFGLWKKNFVVKQLLRKPSVSCWLRTSKHIIMKQCTSQEPNKKCEYFNCSTNILRQHRVKYSITTNQVDAFYQNHPPLKPKPKWNSGIFHLALKSQYKLKLSMRRESTFKNFTSNHLVCGIVWLEACLEIIFG